MSQQQRVSASSPTTTRSSSSPSLRCTCQNPHLTAQLLARDPSYCTGKVYALGPGVISGKSTDAPVGRALLPSASLECDFGAWDVEAKLACPRSKHTTYLSSYHNTPWCTSSLALPHPPHSLSRLIAAGPLPCPLNYHAPSAPRVRLSRPSRHRRCRTPSGVSVRPAFASINRGSVCDIAACTPRLLMLPRWQPLRALFQASPSSADTSKQCIKTSPTAAIPLSRYTQHQDTSLALISIHNIACNASRCTSSPFHLLSSHLLSSHLPSARSNTSITIHSTNACYRLDLSGSAPSPTRTMRTRLRHA